MSLIDYRKSRGLTLAQAAEELGLKSKGTLSDIERGVQPPSPLLALHIERWSGGRVDAAVLSSVIAQMRTEAAA